MPEAGERWRMAAISREGFAGFFGMRGLLSQIDTLLVERNARCWQTAPVPIGNQPMGAGDASPATERDSTRNQSTLRADYGPEWSAWIIVGAAVCAKNSVMRSLIAACGKIVHR